LGEALGYVRYNEEDINLTQEYDDLQDAPNMEAPGIVALRAFAGDYAAKDWIERINNQLSLEFWEWWLTEAIPQAWELAQQSISS